MSPSPARRGHQRVRSVRMGPLATKGPQLPRSLLSTVHLADWGMKSRRNGRGGSSSISRLPNRPAQFGQVGSMNGTLGMRRLKVAAECLLPEALFDVVQTLPPGVENVCDSWAAPSRGTAPLNWFRNVCFLSSHESCADHRAHRLLLTKPPTQALSVLTARGSPSTLTSRVARQNPSRSAPHDGSIAHASNVGSTIPG